MVEPGESVKHLVAWRGRLELVDAYWSLKTGRGVQFNIIQEEGEPLRLHPFAGFVKRRGNRMGTRFHLVAIHPGSPLPIYEGQVMLMAGSSPLGKPMTVEFWLEEDSDRHPFEGCHPRTKDTDGQDFEAVFVELAPDETPVNQTQRNLLENATKPKPHGNSRYAARLCGNELFHMYLAETQAVEGKQMPPEYWANPSIAAIWMRSICEVDSRAEFDADPSAAARFHDLVRRPYAEWCRESGYDDPEWETGR